MSTFQQDNVAPAFFLSQEERRTGWKDPGKCPQFIINKFNNTFCETQKVSIYFFGEGWEIEFHLSSQEESWLSGMIREWCGC